MLGKLAAVQQRLLLALRARGGATGSPGPSAAEMARLTYKLVPDVSELYNNYAKKFCLWAECLYFLKEIGHNDRAETQRLWKQVRCRRLYER
jgi:hypothetical protein